MDSTNLALGLALIFALVVTKILLTAGLSAVVNSRKSILRDRAEEGNINAKRALVIGENAIRLLAAQQFVTIAFNVVITVVLTAAILPPFVDGLVGLGLDATIIQVVIYSLALIFAAALLMIADLLANAVATRRAESIAVTTIQITQLVVYTLTPALNVLLKLSGRIAVWIGGSENTLVTTAEEIKTLVDAGSEEGVLEEEEKEMIYSVIRFGETLAREVMVPRIDIIALEDHATLEESLSMILEAGHSRIPVYNETIDNVVGVLYAKDLLHVWHTGQKPESIKPILRPAYFVPESRYASDILVDLQERKTHLAIVLDEYGGTAGLLTIEDLLEEIVGEIQDEYDTNEEALYQELGEGEYTFNARIDLDDLNYLLDVSLPTDESDTLGGYIFQTLGRVPHLNEEIIDHGLLFRVKTVNGRRIRDVYVKKLPTPEEVEAEEAKAIEEAKAAEKPTAEPKPKSLRPSDPTSVDAGAK